MVTTMLPKETCAIEARTHRNAKCLPKECVTAVGGCDAPGRLGRNLAGRGMPRGRAGRSAAHRESAGGAACQYTSRQKGAAPVVTMHGDHGCGQ